MNFMMWLVDKQQMTASLVSCGVCSICSFVGFGSKALFRIPVVDQSQRQCGQVGTDTFGRVPSHSDSQPSRVGKQMHQLLRLCPVATSRCCTVNIGVYLKSCPGVLGCITMKIRNVSRSCFKDKSIPGPSHQLYFAAI